MGGRGARWIVARFRRREGRRESRGQRVRCGQRFHGTSRVRVNFCLNIFLPFLLIFSLFKFSRYLSDEELRADEEDKEDMVNILYDEWYAREKYRKLNVNTRWPTLIIIFLTLCSRLKRKKLDWNCSENNSSRKGTRRPRNWSRK